MGMAFGNLTERFVMLITDELPTVGNLGEQVIEAGDHEDTDQGSHEHSADCRRTDRPVSDGPRTGGSHQRNQTGNEGEGGHHNRAETQLSSLNGSISDTQAFSAPLHREFNNQNGILAQKPHEHDEADLTVDIIRQPHQLQHQKRPEESDRQGKNDRQRQDEALVLPRQNQVHEHDHNEKNVGRSVPAISFVVRESLPADPVSLGEIFGNFLDRRNRLTATVAGGRSSLDNRRCVEVVTVDLVHPLAFLDLHKRRVGDHFPIVVF